MMENAFLLLLVISFITFFAAFFRRGAEAIALSAVSALLFIVTAAASVSVDVATSGGVVPYTGNAPIGLISIGFAIVAGGLAIARLEDVI